MARSDEDPSPDPTPGSAAWLASYSARFAQAAEDTMRVGTAAADRWARRSLQDGEWSVDTVTADVIADWEEMTPLLGRWLDLWLEAVQQGLGGGERPGMAARRMREYGELWDDAAGKLRDASYRSEDLLDDWFRFWGKAVRDMTAGSALLWGAAAPRPQARPDGGQEHGTEAR
jgi:hypothetical protein